MHLLIDMNLTPRWVPYLLSAGYEVRHWVSVGDASARDQEICDYARLHGFVLLTNHLDFPRILAHTKESKPSVVLLRGEPLSPEARGVAVARALADCKPELIQGCIVTLDWSNEPRARVLPLN